MVPRHLFSRLLARLLLLCSDGGSRGGAGLFFSEWGRGGAPDRKACVSCHPQRCRCSGLVRGGRTACLCVRAVRDVLKGTRSCCWTFFSPPSPRFVVSREGRRPDFPHPLQRALPPLPPFFGRKRSWKLWPLPPSRPHRAIGHNRSTLKQAAYL